MLQDDPQGRLGDECPPGKLRCQETPFLQTQCDEVNQVSITSVIFPTHTHIERANRARRMAQAQAVETVLTFCHAC